MKTTNLPIFPFMFVMAVVGQSLNGSGAAAQDGEKGIARERGNELTTIAAGKRMAILVGVQDYYSLPKLKYCNRDVDLLATTLRTHCGFDRVVKLTDAVEARRFQPTRSNIVRELQTWLEVANDAGYKQVLVYFSGHGFVGKQGNLYFAPPGSDRKTLELTGLPLSFVRERLNACNKVPVKMLVLDTCHSGENKSAGNGVTGDDVKDLFGDVRGLLTLSSCKSDQVSVEWDDKRQGLFTYWLCEGLRGQADRDAKGQSGHGEIDHLELYRFVQSNVLETSADLGSIQHVKQQESEDWQGIAVLARVTPGDSVSRVATLGDRTVKPFPEKIEAPLPPRIDAPLPSRPALTGVRTYIMMNTASSDKAMLYVRHPGDKYSTVQPKVPTQFSDWDSKGMEFFDGAKWVPLPRVHETGPDLSLRFFTTRESGKVVWNYTINGAQAAAPNMLGD